MSNQDLTVFQRVLEALERARDAGEEALRGDKLTREQDDQDCYPHGVIITMARGSEELKVIRFLGKNLNWVSLGPRGALSLRPKSPIELRLKRLTYVNAISDSLCQDGIECVADVYWR